MSEPRVAVHEAGGIAVSFDEGGHWLILLEREHHNPAQRVAIIHTDEKAMAIDSSPEWQEAELVTRVRGAEP